MTPFNKSCLNSRGAYILFALMWRLEGYTKLNGKFILLGPLNSLKVIHGSDLLVLGGIFVLFQLFAPSCPFFPLSNGWGDYF